MEFMWFAREVLITQPRRWVQFTSMVAGLPSTSVISCLTILSDVVQHRQVEIDFKWPSDASMPFVSLVDCETINSKAGALNSAASVFSQQLRRSIPNCSAAATVAITNRFPTLASLIQYGRSVNRQTFVVCGTYSNEFG